MYENWKNNFLVENLPGILLMTIISAVMVRYVWGGKKRSKALGTKAIVIVSCDSVVGWECAKRLDKLGFHVFAGFVDRDSEKAQRLRSRTSSRVTIIKLDVTDENEIAKAVKYVSDNLPPGTKGLYCLLNNTMSLLQGDFDWYTTGQCEELVERNLLGNIRTTKHFLSLLKEEKGRVINISSAFGLHAYPYNSIFSATNAALEKFSECLSFELDNLNIVISIVEEQFLSVDGQSDNAYNLEENWEKMSEDDKELYSYKYDNFRRIVKKDKTHEMRLSKEYRKLLINTLEEAILTDYPKTHYRALPYTLRMGLMEALCILPNFLKQPLVKFFFYSNLNQKYEN